MSKTQILSLGEYWNQFIEEELKTGRYSSASGVVRNALRLLEEKENNAKLEFIRSALIEGEESEDAGRLNMDKIRKLLKSRIK